MKQIIAKWNDTSLVLRIVVGLVIGLILALAVPGALVIIPLLGTLFVFRLSFLAWEILAAFTCGLSVIYVTPYMNLAIAGYTQYLKKEALHETTTKEEPNA